MPKQFAKLVDSKLEMLAKIPFISNPSEHQFEEYAAENGYKEFIAVKQPGMFYIKGYNETETTITEEWSPWDLNAAKQNALVKVQNELDNLLDQRTTLHCESFANGIVYDQNALTNAMGLEPGDMFIDAKDKLHTLTEENIVEIKKALKEYRLELYGGATIKRKAVDDATNVDEVEAVLKDLLG